MSLTSIILIVVSAWLHVVSHAAMKRAQNRMAFIWWMWFWAVLFISPVLMLTPQRIPRSGWACMGVSAICSALYYRSIANAYRTGDLSIVYPWARGTAPIFILAWSMLVLNERPNWGGIIGIGVIATGLAALNLPCLRSWRDLPRAFATPAPRWALAAGLCTSLYTTVDRVGVSDVSPLFYTYVTMTAMLACLTPGILKAIGWRGLKAEFDASKFNSMIAGLLAATAYGIVLVAMRQGLPASYAGATREIGVVFGTLIGIVLLKEPGTVMRVSGSVLIATGAGTVAVFG